MVKKVRNLFLKIASSRILSGKIYPSTYDVDG
jgi:hypothetical protein